MSTTSWHPKTRGSRLHQQDPSLLEEAVALYRDGVSFAEIGAKVGVSSQTCRRWLIEAGEHPETQRARSAVSRECSRCRARKAQLDKAHKLLSYYRKRERDLPPLTIGAALSMLEPSMRQALIRALAGVSGWSSAARAACQIRIPDLLK